MVVSDTFTEFLREQLAPLGRVTMRRMFGKAGAFCDGLMFGMVAFSRNVAPRPDRLISYLALCQERQCSGSVTECLPLMLNTDCGTYEGTKDRI
jgi:TfoX N-terminal domain